jgi:hypothetical protein
MSLAPNGRPIVTGFPSAAGVASDPPRWGLNVGWGTHFLRQVCLAVLQLVSNYEGRCPSGSDDREQSKSYHQGDKDERRCSSAMRPYAPQLGRQHPPLAVEWSSGSSP